MEQISIKQMLKIDPSLSDLSEDELRQLRTELYDQAELMFDIYWERKSGSKNPTGLLPKSNDSGIVSIWTKKKEKQE